MHQAQKMSVVNAGQNASGVFESFFDVVSPIALPSFWLNLKSNLFNFMHRQLSCLNTRMRRRVGELKRQSAALKTEEEKTEALLLNILPPAVAAELRATGSVEPLTCDDVTVCFTDFVGFTLASEKLTACELVATLHRYFTEFDEIVSAHGLEKLKTIGDSYMFVSGLPKAKPSHAVDAVRAALEIVEAVKRMSHDGPGWSIRVGIHSGPVVAGVVGTRKFSFDIWGETVNLASRHESSGVPNCVNISARTYDLVRDHIPCEPRGPVRIKEGRQLEMYFAQPGNIGRYQFANA